MAHSPAAPPTDEPSPSAPDSASAIARGGVWAFGGLLLGAALQFGYNVGLARTFGASATGVFAFALSLTSIAAVAGQFGARETMLRYVAAYRSLGDRERLSGVFRQMGWLALASSAAMGVLVVVLAPSVAGWSDKPEVRVPLLIMAWTVPLYAAIKALAAALQGGHRIGLYTSLHDVGRPLSIGVGLAVAVVLGLTFETFLVLSTVALGLVALAALALALREFWPSLRTRPRFETREWFTFSGTVIVLDLLRSSTGWVDTILVGFFLSSADVGVYFAALRIALLITLAIGAFSTVMSPIASGLWSRGDVAGLGAAFSTATRWTCAFAIPATIAALLLREDLLVLFGDEFTGPEAQRVLVVVILGRFVLGLTGGVGRLLVMTGHERVELADAVGLLLVLLVGTWWAVPQYGLVGAAVVNAAGVATVNVVKLLQTWWLVGVQPYDRSYLKLVVAGAAGAALGVGADHALAAAPAVLRIVALAAAVGVGFLGALAALGLERADREALAGVRRRLGL